MFLKRRKLILASFNVSISKYEATKSSCRLLDLKPLRHSIAERTMAKDTLGLIQEIALE